MLLKRTTAKAASRVYKAFLKQYPNIKKLVDSDEEDIKIILSPLGYSKRAHEIKNAAKFIAEHFRSGMPMDRDSLLEIPFIGNYTSNAILSISYGRPYPMVDSNVNRILNRVYFGTNPPSGNISRDVMQIAQSVLPNKEHRLFNFTMLDLGGTLCLPRNPKCTICPLLEICKFARKNKHASQITKKYN